MKRIYCLLFVTAVIGCSQNDIPGAEDQTRSQELAEKDVVVSLDAKYKRTPSQAEMIAQEMSLLYEEGSVLKKSADTFVMTGEVAKSSGRRTVDTLLYIVNFADKDGFAFVSPDRRSGDVLFYAESGNFTLSDTIDNPILKFRVDLTLGYQKQNYEQAANAKFKGEEYLGRLEPSVIEESEDVLFLGQRGDGGTTGPTNCVPATHAVYPYYWSGKASAITYAKAKYPSNCFGTSVSPPSVSSFACPNAPGGIPGPDAPPCTGQYCNPHITTLDQYYQYYGCSLQTTEITLPPSILNKTVGPLLTFTFGQGAPLNYDATNTTAIYNGYRWYAGCTIVAVYQILAYHGKPASCTSVRYGGTIYSSFSAIRNCQDNDHIVSAGYALTAGKFAREIGARLNANYQPGGTSAVSNISNSINVFGPFGYTLDYSYTSNYNDVAAHFPEMKESLDRSKPVLMRGESSEVNHAWVADGYKEFKNPITRGYIYRFNSSGSFTGYTVPARTYNYTYQLHINAGWGSTEHLYWLDHGLYIYGGYNFDTAVSFAPGITPPVS